MPRAKKQRLKRRKDGRYCCVYHGKQFLAWTEEEALAKREEYKRTGGPGPTAIIGWYAPEWLKREKAGAADQTKAEARALLKKLTDRIGHLRFDEVKPSDIKQIYAEAFAGMSDSYIRAAVQLYRALFQAAMDDGYCRTNPAKADSAKPPRGRTETKTRAITQQERTWIETLCTDHRAHAAVMAMLYAGLRPQEAKALDIDRDIDKDTITIRQSVHLSGTNKYTATNTLKTQASRRTIPLLPPLKQAIEKKHGPLIASASGGEVTVQSWRSLWESYVTAMETAINGCPERWYGRKREHKGKELPPFIRFTVRPYDLRHSFCTWCRDNGVEINTCIHWMGHTDAKMILKVYDEFSEERSRKEAEKLANHMQKDVQK